LFYFKRNYAKLFNNLRYVVYIGPELEMALWNWIRGLNTSVTNRWELA